MSTGNFRTEVPFFIFRNLPDIFKGYSLTGIVQSSYNLRSEDYDLQYIALALCSLRAGFI